MIDESGIKHMLKTPPSKNASYTNGCVSEYLGCKIFASLGFDTQETRLGIYTINGKDKVCVLCKDFETENKKLVKFAELKNGVMESPESGFGVELSSVLTTIEEQDIIDPIYLKRFFWEMFIVDALLGDFDRHNGNWGFLIDEDNAEVQLAPIYDCGSCLYPQASEDVMKKTLVDENERNARVYVFPNSALKINNKKVNYLDFIRTNQYEECTNALFNVTGRIDMGKIFAIIDEVECISDLQKSFYKTMIQERKEIILDQSIKFIQKNIMK